MNKALLVTAGLSLSVLLGACGETEELDAKLQTQEEKQDTTEEKEPAKDKEPTASKEKEEEIESKKIEQVVLDNENAKITLLSVKEKYDDIFGQQIEVKFDVENKRQETITIQADDVSADGRMVTGAYISMSDSINVGKIGNATLNMMELEGEEFPEMKSNLELTLNVFSFDSDYSEEIPVKIEF